MDNSLVSVIVPTKNSSGFLDKCLESIKNQTYKNLEIVVVDNNSTDNTKEIAKKYTDKVFNQGPERSAQRNYGVKNCGGDQVLIIDSDMELSDLVVEQCMAKINSVPEIKGVIIPEESFGKGFWAKCKKLEKSFYVGVEWMEAARFFTKNDFLDVGGYNENMVSGEDWDLSQKIGQLGKISRIDQYIFHNEGYPKLYNILKKKFYYAQNILKYLNENKSQQNIKKQADIVQRYKLFFSQPKKLFKNPFVGVGMLFMKTCEFGFGGSGYLIGKFMKI